MNPLCGGVSDGDGAKGVPVGRGEGARTNTDGVDVEDEDGFGVPAENVCRGDLGLGGCALGDLSPPKNVFDRSLRSLRSLRSDSAAADANPVGSEGNVGVD